MKLNKNHIKGLKYILHDLESKGTSDRCPFFIISECSYDVYNETAKKYCGKLFPSLLWEQNLKLNSKILGFNGYFKTIYCPCDAIRDSKLKLGYVIRRVKRAIKEEKI